MSRYTIVNKIIYLKIYLLFSTTWWPVERSGWPEYLMYITESEELPALEERPRQPNLVNSGECPPAGHSKSSLRRERILKHVAGNGKPPGSNAADARGRSSGSRWVAIGGLRCGFCRLRAGSRRERDPCPRRGYCFPGWLGTSLGGKGGKCSPSESGWSIHSAKRVF